MSLSEEAVAAAAASRVASEDNTKNSTKTTPSPPALKAPLYVQPSILSLIGTIMIVWTVCICRLLSDQFFPPEVPLVVTFENGLDRSMEMCWLGTITDASIAPTACFQIAAKERQSFNAHLWHMHLVRSPAVNETSRPLWSIVVILPGMNEVFVHDQLPTFGLFDSEFVVRNVLRGFLHPYYPVRWVNHHREFFCLVVFLTLLSVALYDWFKGRKEEKEKEKEKEAKSKKNDDGAATTTTTTSPAPPAAATTMSSHDILKGIAFICMILDHFGRCFDAENLWYRVPSRALSMPFFFFLNGYGTNPVRHATKRNSTLKLLIGFAIIHYGFGVTRMSGGTVLLNHAIAHLVLSRIDLSAYTLIEHAYISAVLILLRPLVGDGLLFDAGTAPFLFAICGQLASGHSLRNRLPMLLYLATGTLTHLSNNLRAEYRSAVVKQGGSWKGVWLPTVVACLLFTVELVLLALYRRRPVARKGFLRGLLRFCSIYGLELYVIHVIVFDVVASAIHGVPEKFYL